MQNHWRSLVPGILTFSFLTPLAAHAYVGSFSRFMADDFCSANIAGSRGVLRATLYWYMNWTGRYSANYLDSLAGQLGPYALPYIPALAILMWGFALVLVLYQLKLAAQNPARLLLAVLAAALVLHVTLSNTPLVSQSLYWGQGMRSLVPPLVLLMVYGGFLSACLQAACVQVACRQAAASQSAGLQTGGLPDRRTPVRLSIWMAVSFGIAFIAAGFSETGAVLQITLLALALLIGLLLGGPDFRKSAAPLLAAGLLGSFAAIAAIVLAPGNIARENFYPRHPGLFELVKITLYSALKFIRQAAGLDSPIDLQLFFHQLLNLTSLIILPALAGLGVFGSQGPQNGRNKLWIYLLFGIPLAAAILLVSCFVPAAYARSAGPPNRTKIIPDFLLVCSLAGWGYILGAVLRTCKGVEWSFSKKRFMGIAFAAICAAFALNAIWDSTRVLQSAPAFRRYAAAWDENHQKILDKRAAGKRRVIVQPLRNPAGLDEIAPDPRFWVNKCASSYYGVRVSSYQSDDQNLTQPVEMGPAQGQ